MKLNRVEAEAMFPLAAKCVISYDVGKPSKVKASEEEAKLAKRPKRYSVFSSAPLKVRVISTRPWTLSARMEELIDSAYRV